MKAFLQGRWLRHPVHPMLVDFPMALWPAAVVLDVLSRIGAGSVALTQASFYAILFGLASSLLAVPAGLADWLDIRKEKPAWRLGLAHMVLNLTIAMLSALNLGLRIDLAPRAPRPLDRARQALRLPGAPPQLPVRPRAFAATPWLPLTLSVVASLLLVVSGYLGGRMVYDQGTSVARQSKSRLRHMALEGGARVPGG